MRVTSIRIQFERFPGHLDSLFILDLGNVAIRTAARDERDRIQLICSLALREPFFIPTHRSQEEPVTLMTHTMTRVEFDGSLVLFLRARPVPVDIQSDACQGHMRFADRVINLQGLPHGRLRLGKGCAWGEAALEAQHSIRVGQPSVSQGELRILCNRLLEVLNTFQQRGIAPLVPDVNSD